MNTLWAVILMICTGILDAQAFDRIPLIWQRQGHERAATMLTILAYINAGMLTYFASTYFIGKQGVHNSFIISLIYFITTMMTLAIMGGNFASFTLIDKILAAIAILCISLLYLHGVS